MINIDQHHQVHLVPLHVHPRECTTNPVATGRGAKVTSDWEKLRVFTGVFQFNCSLPTLAECIRSTSLQRLDLLLPRPRTCHVPPTILAMSEAGVRVPKHVSIQLVLIFLKHHHHKGQTPTSKPLLLHCGSGRRGGFRPLGALRGSVRQRMLHSISRTALVSCQRTAEHCVGPLGRFQRLLCRRLRC